MTGNVVIAEDVTQEVFMTLIEHGGRFDPARGTLASFLYGIARNCVLRRLEKDRRTDAKLEDSAAEDDLLEDLTRRETIEQVRRAVLSLPATYREAVVLCDLQDVSYQDAADALGCPVGTVRSRLNRGRAMLARKLGEGRRRRAPGRVWHESGTRYSGGVAGVGRRRSGHGCRAGAGSEAAARVSRQGSGAAAEAARGVDAWPRRQCC